MSNIQTHNQANAEAALARIQGELAAIDNGIAMAGTAAGAIVLGIIFPGVGAAFGPAVGAAIVGMKKLFSKKRGAWSKFTENEKSDIIDGLITQIVWVDNLHGEEVSQSTGATHAFRYSNSFENRNLNQETREAAWDSLIAYLVEYDILIDTKEETQPFKANNRDWIDPRIVNQFFLREETLRMTKAAEKVLRTAEQKLAGALRVNARYKAIDKMQKGQLSPEEVQAIKQHWQKHKTIQDSRRGTRPRLRQNN